MRKTGAHALLASFALMACGKSHPPFLVAPEGVAQGEKPDSGGLYIPPPTPPAADAGGLCGNLKIPIVIDRPNFYFVLDDSGSMSTPMPDDATTSTGAIPSRYSAAWLALRELLRAVGHRISYGAALFPGEAGGCTPGAEVFPTQAGDLVSYAISHEDGPIENELLNILSAHAPGGSTPTAVSIDALSSTLTALPGKTYAFLLTDGAPNCDADAACNTAACTINIEQQCPLEAGQNCCDPKYGVADYRSCLDADPTVQAVASLATAGVQTFVIGLSSDTDAYASVLDRLAEAGQTARPSEPEYYPAKSTTELTAALQQTGLSVAISCDIPLQTVPPDPNLVNVFFDESVVPLNASNGWTWVSASEIRLVGTECEILKSGSVRNVQVVAGCPSATR